MTDDFTDEVNILDPNPLAEHDEWEQTIKDEGVLISANERYRIRQSATDYPKLWCGTCNVEIPTENTTSLSTFHEAAVLHEAEVHS